MSGADEPEARCGPPPGRPRDDLIYFAVETALMIVFLVFNVLNVRDEVARGGHYLAIWKPTVWEGSSGVVFLFLTPVIMLLVRRVWPLDRPYLPRLAIHAGAAVVISLIHVLAAGALRWGAYHLVGDYYAPLAPLGDWPYEFRKDVFVYLAIAGPYVGWRIVRRVDPTPGASAEVLEVRDGARRHFVPLTEVVWVEAAGNYVELHRGGAGLLHRASLSEMERRLQTAGFVRIHRSRLVRREAVAAVESKPTGDFVVRLRDGRELAGSRRYRHPLLAD